MRTISVLRHQGDEYLWHTHMTRTKEDCIQNIRIPDDENEMVLQTLVYLPFKNLTGLEDRKIFTENLEAIDLDLWTLPVSIWM
jgi:hypothetical protein